jgi:hypothetical protein
MNDQDLVIVVLLSLTVTHFKLDLYKAIEIEIIFHLLISKKLLLILSEIIKKSIKSNFLFIKI